MSIVVSVMTVVAMVASMMAVVPSMEVLGVPVIVGSDKPVSHVDQTEDSDHNKHATEKSEAAIGLPLHWGRGLLTNRDRHLLNLQQLLFVHSFSFLFP